ncbi:MAG: hypothetical protein ISS47_08475 [Candidatus Omnitrophica bacterium]|nr:hypothetical protein [Candidatus Omnitrophota bacterium]
MIKAFVGHSFLKDDKGTVDRFKEYFNSLLKSMDFQWEDAQEVQIRSLSDKVKQKMEGKNLFIGIITKKHIEIDENKILIPKLFNKDKCTALKANCKWGVSYWIIQESGYAIAKGMRVLFLIEDVVKELQGLQNDIEYIPFTRGRESDCYPSLNTALGNLLKEIKGVGERAATEEPATDSKAEMEKKPKVEESNKDKAKEKSEDDYYWEIYAALYQKDDKKINSLKEEILDKVKGNTSKTIEWQGKILNLESRVLKKNVLYELTELDKESPNNPSILSWIAFELEKYENYKDAAEKYLTSAQYEKTNFDRLFRIGYASEAYAKNKDSGKALDILLNELKEGLPKEEEFRIYKYLSDTVKILKDDDLFIVFAEKSLSLNPSDDSLRFDLAYKYSELNEHALSLHHYKILIKSNPTGANLNNLAVAYEKLEMPGKAVKFYREAVKYDSTISMANLAQQFLNAGFIEEANVELKKAMGYENYEKDNVGRALSRIESMTKSEEEKEKKAVESIENIRQFKLEYAEAYSFSFIVNDEMRGKWSTRHGEFDIKLESGNILRAEREDSTPESTSGFFGLALQPYLGPGTMPQPNESVRKKKIFFEGRIIHNRVLEYKIRIEEGSSRRSLLDSLPGITGIGIISKTMNTIKVMETDKDKKTSFYEFVRK